MIDESAGRPATGATDLTGAHLTGAGVLAQAGLVAEPAAPASEARFPDGAHYRIEIPSVEGPAVLKAVVAAAAAHGITVNRVSQGSGAMLLSASELAEMAKVAADTGIEVSLFVGPREEWDIGRAANSPDGQVFAGRLRGTRQLRYAVDDIVRAAEQGIRGFLIGDPGLLKLVTGLQAAGQLPASIVWKVSAVLAPSNPERTFLAMLSSAAITSLEFAVNNPECEMERPWEWIAHDPDFGCLRSTDDEL